MNKKHFLQLISIIMTVILLVGCSGKKETQAPTENTTEETTLQTKETATTGPSGAVDVGESDEEGFIEPETTAATEETSPENETEETTDPTEDEEPTTEATDPEETTDPTEATEPGQGTNNGACCEYGAYINMTPAQQQEYMMSFASIEEFVAWAMQAEAQHDAHGGDNVIEGGDVDIGDYIG